MSSSILISAVIITHNEKKNILRCLQSLRDVADEIIVLDSFSTDNTVQIAEENGATVFTHAWEGYSAQKNFGNTIAKNHWILSLDADEAVSQELKVAINKIKNNPKADGYQLSRLTNYCGHWIRHGDWYPDYKLRLWNKSLGNWHGLIHEEIILPPNSNIQKLSGNLHHYSYYSVLDHVAQMHKFTELMAQDNIVNNRKASLFKIVLSPPTKFIKSYFIHLGFLDGFYGFVVAVMSAHATFLKYIRTRELGR